jgi:transposase
VVITKVELEKLQFERADFKRQLDDLKRMIFGKKSERFIGVDKSQLELFEQQLAAQEEEIEKHIITYERLKSKKKKEKPVRTAIPAHFPRVEEIIEPDNIPEGSVKIGEEVTELLEIKPLTVFVRRIVRPKYALPEEQGVIIADLPSLPIPKGNASASLLTFILIAKFVDHLPLYRILQVFKRQDLVISKSTIGGWVAKASALLQPLYDTFKDKFLEDADYIQADESPIKVQDKNKKKTTHRGFMWVYRNPNENLVLFEYHKGRGKNVPEAFFKNFTGTLQSDGYTAYQNLTTKGDITLLGCMAHARRYFEKALDNDPKRSEHVLFLIQRLYKMERKAKQRKVTVDVIKRYRMACALPILNEIESYLKRIVTEVLPKSSIGVAARYTLNIFDNLKQYIYDGRFEIDNNNIENAIRPLAIGRKNYLFAGSHEAAQNIAMFYTFFATCKKLDINPFTWLTDVINRIPEHKANKLKELLPQNWKPLIKT